MFGRSKYADREQELDELLDKLVGLRESWEKLIAHQLEDINNRWAHLHPRQFEERIIRLEMAVERLHGPDALRRIGVRVGP